MAGPGELIAALRRWTRDHDAHVRAAVELLIGHGYWLERDDFTRACVQAGARDAWLSWDRAGEFLDGPGVTASGSQKAVLALAIALAEDQYRLSRASDQEAAVVMTAVAASLALPFTLTGAPAADIAARDRVQVTLSLDQRTAGLLLALRDQEYGPFDLEGVLWVLAGHARDGVLRPASWERDWLTPPFGSGWHGNLEPDPDVPHHSRPRREEADGG